MFARRGRCFCNSHRQLVDCLAHRAIEVVQLLLAQSPAEGGTDFRASQPKLDVICLVDHCVLLVFQSIGQQETGKIFTLIIARITLTEPKTALTGVTLEISFTRFRVSMAAFNAEIAPSRSSGRWDSVFMVKREVVVRELYSIKAVRKVPSSDRDECAFLS